MNTSPSVQIAANELESYGQVNIKYKKYCMT